MAVNPNSLANLRAPWQRGEQGTAGVRYVERMVSRAQKAGPQAIRLLHQAMRNPELPMSLRCRIAEYIVDKAWPKEAQNTLISGLNGVEWLELRFTAPGGSTESHRIDLEPNVGESMGQIIDAEPEASDIKDIEHE